MKLFGEKEWTIDRIWRLILAAVVIFAVYEILSTLRSVLLPFALAFVIAYLLSPVVALFTTTRLCVNSFPLFPPERSQYP